MGDIPNIEKNRIVIEGPTGNDHKIDAQGSSQSILFDSAGSALIGQKVMTASIPVVIASNQTSIPVTTEGLKATYSAAVSAFIPPAAATDIFTIQGSASKVIRITYIIISCTTSAGSGISINASIIKRSAANTGGTFATLTNVPNDSSDAPATAVVKIYTVNPTALGASVGIVRTQRFQINTSGTSSNELIFEMGTRPAKTIVLRGTSEFLNINFGGATITNPLCSISIEWTEET